MEITYTKELEKAIARYNNAIIKLENLIGAEEVTDKEVLGASHYLQGLADMLRATTGKSVIFEIDNNAYPFAPITAYHIMVKKPTEPKKYKAYTITSIFDRRLYVEDENEIDVTITAENEEEAYNKFVKYIYEHTNYTIEQTRAIIDSHPIHIEEV